MIRYPTLLLDADMTLLDFKKSEESAAHRAFEAFGLTLTDDIYARYHVINDGLWKALERGEITRGDIMATRFQALFRECGLNGPTDGSFETTYQRMLGEGAFVLDGAEEVLAALQPHCRMYIVTNGEKHTQHNRMNKCGLLKYLDGVFISEEIGAVKPEKRFFDIVMDAIGHPGPETVLVVGDSLSSDIRGGENAGLDTCWLNPGGKANTSGVRVTHEIRDIRQLPEVVLGRRQ